MRLIVFGSTGLTGLAVLKLSTSDPDLQVTAFVRKPSKIPEDIRSKVKVVVGDVHNVEDVKNALEGQDAVISCLGGPISFFTPFYILSTGIKHVVEGMREHQIKKLAVVNSGMFLPGKSVPFFLKNLLADHKRVIDFLHGAKDIEWTLLMPPFIKDLPNTTNYDVAINKIPGGSTVAAQDMAHWMLSYMKDEKSTDEYRHQMVGISSTYPSAFPRKSVFAVAGLAVLAAAVVYYVRYL